MVCRLFAHQNQLRKTTQGDTPLAAASRFVHWESPCAEPTVNQQGHSAQTLARMRGERHWMLPSTSKKHLFQSDPCCKQKRNSLDDSNGGEEVSHQPPAKRVA